MGNYGFANVMAENQGIFAVLIYLVMFLPAIIAYFRPSKYLKGICSTMAFIFIFGLLTSPSVWGFELLLSIGLDGMALITGILFIMWIIGLILAFIKDDKK